MVEPIKITYRNGAYYANRPNWDGGDVVMASEYAALKAENERLEIAKREAIAGWKDAERALAERAGGVKGEWHRADGDKSILLYTLRQDGWRKGEAVMVNDVTVRIEAANGSESPIEPIASAILSALTTEPAAPEGQQEHEHIEVTDAGLLQFADWFRKNYPGPDTIIHKPDWHAPKIYRAARHAMRQQEPEGQQPVAYRVHAPADEHYEIGPDRLQFHPLAQYDLDNGYRQTPLYTRPAEQAVTDEMVDAAEEVFFKTDDHGEPSYDMRAALKAAMEAGR